MQRSEVPHIFDRLSKVAKKQHTKVDFVLVFEHKFKHLVDKVQEQFEATGLTVQQVGRWLVGLTD